MVLGYGGRVMPWDYQDVLKTLEGTGKGVQWL